MKRIVCLVAIALMLPLALSDQAKIMDAATTLDTASIEQLTGAKGKLDEKEGVFKVSVPRSDLTIIAAGVHLTPPMGLTSWAAFKLHGKETMVMGDTVLAEDQVNAVMSVALDNGLEVTALHNHFFWDTPKVMFMHIGGMGPTEKLATAVGKVFTKIKETSGGKGEKPEADIDPANTTLDPAKIEAALGLKGDLKDGVYKVVVGRTAKMHGSEVGNAMGVNTWAAFAGTDERAVVDGDFAMLESEVQGVLKALRSAGIDVVAIHQHMIGDEPRIVFLHYWGVGRTADLAKGLRAALDRTAGSARPEPSLTKVIDLPLPGKATRFDYQSYDPTAQRLYFTHMGDGELLVLDTDARKIVARLPGFPTTTGVLVVPELHKVFVSIPGNHEVAVLDTRTLKVLARIPDGEFPDGLAFAPEVHKVFVSDEKGGKETVIDARSNKRIGSIDLGGEIGNTQYDPVSHLIFANVQTKGELVSIDPNLERIVGRHPWKGGEGPHGLLIVAPKRLAFAACEGDSKLLVLDMDTFEVKQVFSTGEGPDVLAFDSALERLYVAAESGIVSIFQLHDRTLEKREDLSVGPHAHTISVNPGTHEVYLPLKDVDGHPVLRIMKPPRS